MKTVKLIGLLILTSTFLISCGEDEEPCVENTYYLDADQDGLGDPDVTISACELPEGYVENDNDNDDTQAIADVISGTVNNLFAPQQGGQGEPISGEFTKFDFDTESETTSDTDWDIAFRGTTILVNGGESSGITDEPERTGDAAVYIVNDALFSEVTSVTPDLFKQDSQEQLAIPTGSGEGWYNYNPQAFVVTPIPGTVLVFRTTEGRYAKIEILSYYKDAPAEPNAFTDESRYFTFNYTYQPNNNIETFNE